LFRFSPKQGESEFLLQLRSEGVDYPRTWGIPGGAIRERESPEAAAIRELEEEIGVIPSFAITETHIQDCGGGWTFYCILADVESRFTAFSVRETDATGWFTVDEMHALRMHPELRRWMDGLLQRRSV